MQVTAENIFEIAEWCEGFVKRSDFDGVLKTYIEVPVTVKNGVKRDKAFVHDWVTRTDRSFKAYRNEAFKIAFEQDTLTDPEVRHEEVYKIIRHALLDLVDDGLHETHRRAVKAANKIVEIFEGEMG
jgi:hypothetical protein